ncbi:MAG: hypothetical protein ABIF40_03385 [archaeon]
MKDKLTVLVNHAPHGFGPGIVSVAEIARIMEHAGIGKDKYQMIVPMVNSWEVNDPVLGKLPITEKIFLKDQPFTDLPILFDKNLGTMIDTLNFKGEGHYGNRLQTILKKQYSVQEDVDNYLKNQFEVRQMGTDNNFIISPKEIDFVFGHNPIVDMMPSQTPSYFSTIAPFSRLIEASIMAMQSCKLTPIYEIPGPEILFLIGSQIEQRQNIFFTSTPSTLTGINHEKHLAPNEIIVPPLKDRMIPEDEINEEGIYVIRSGIGLNVPHLLDQLENLVASARATGLTVYSASKQHGEVYARETACAHPNIKAVVGRLGLSAVYLAHVHGKPMITFGYQKDDDTEMFFNEQTFTKNGTIVVLDDQVMSYERLHQCTRNVNKVYGKVEKQYGTLSGDEVIANKVVEDLRRLKVL